jgi:hypothetical protein
VVLVAVAVAKGMNNKKRKQETILLEQQAAVRLITNQEILTVIDDQLEIDHRLFPRGQRTKYDHERAHYCIYSDYLSTVPRFDGKEFEQMFHLSRSRFQKLMEDIGRTRDPFYVNQGVDNRSKKGACLEARLLLPIKSMAYGVPPHVFRDYFQMSTTLAKECCYNFWRIIPQLYQFEFLRMPTAEDLANITKLHQAVHGVPGMFGSLDCMHTWWKNCPKAWQGSYKGKEKRCTIVLEAAADHHLWFWHAAYGYAGTLSDKNIIDVSPLIDRILDGTFEQLESNCVPFQIGDKSFNRLYMLVDAIYPEYGRFVKANAEPITDVQKRYSSWQEGARKDIERAFGVLQCKWQCISRPIYLLELRHIREMVTSSLILHNMCVSDRVMGTLDLRYNPAHCLLQDGYSAADVDQPRDLVRRQGTTVNRFVSCITHISGDRDVYKVIVGKNRFCVPDDDDHERRYRELVSLDENTQLTEALRQLKGNRTHT